MSVSRRAFLGTAAAACSAAPMTSLDLLQHSVLADELKRQQKRVILLWLAGGASQLETFDPKPGRPTGGPFRDIATCIPGVRISELMPKMAARLNYTAIVRSLDTNNGDHGGGARLMHLGRRDEPSVKYPDLGAMLARELGRVDSQVPDYVSFYTATEGRGSAVSQSGFLGSRYNAMFLTEKNVPPNLRRLDMIEELDHVERADLRALLAKNFAHGRTSPSLASHNESYARVRGLMASEKLFDISQEPEAMRAKYGPTLFGEQCLIARRLVEAGVPFVKVSRAWWDSHGQNFETHLELVTELDNVMAALLDDLSDRGLLENTLVVTLSEFGRTPQINSSLGRDHFASAWSSTLSGCGVKGGAVWGASDEDGHKVKDGKVGAAELFATIFRAVGIDPEKNYYVGSRPLPLVDAGHHAISELLS